MALKAGTMLNEEVRLVEPLSGSTGDNVWLADQLDWKKKVVVKLLPALKAKDDDALERFLAAAAQAQDIESSHVCRIHDFGVADDFTPYVIVERLSGETLDARVRASDHIPPRQAGEIIAQVAEVLDEAHAMGLLHLGLSPHTVFLQSGSSVQVKVMDLGVASALPIDRQSAYVAPERYLGRAADKAADLWSLGALAYLMLTGQHAVDAAKRRLMQWDFDPPSEMWLADVPPEVDAWFDQALHKVAGKRFASGAAMSSAFAKLIDGLEHLRGAKGAAKPALESHQVVEVGAPRAAPAAASSEVIVQEATDDAPAIVIDVED